MVREGEEIMLALWETTRCLKCGSSRAAAAYVLSACLAMKKLSIRRFPVGLEQGAFMFRAMQAKQ